MKNSLRNFAAKVMNTYVDGRTIAVQKLANVVAKSTTKKTLAPTMAVLSIVSQATTVVASGRIVRGHSVLARIGGVVAASQMQIVLNEIYDEAVDIQNKK